MRNWLRSRGWTITCLLLIVALVASIGIQIDSRDSEDGLVRIGVGQEKVLRIGNQAAYAAGLADFVFTGVADNMPFQNALNALPATGGRLVVVSAVQINFAASTNVTKAIPNVTIEGTGVGTYFTGDGVTPEFVAGGNNWRLVNCRFDVPDATLRAAMGATTGWSWDNVLAGAILYDRRNPSYSVIGGAIIASSVTDSGLTSGRVVLAGSSGLLTDSSNLTYSLATNVLSVPTGRVATIIIASTNATTIEKSQADQILTGVADQTIINTAIQTSPTKILFLGPSFNCTGAIVVDKSNISLDFPASSEINATGTGYALFDIGKNAVPLEQVTVKFGKITGTASWGFRFIGAGGLYYTIEGNSLSADNGVWFDSTLTGYVNSGRYVFHDIHPLIDTGDAFHISSVGAAFNHEANYLYSGAIVRAKNAVYMRDANYNVINFDADSPLTLGLDIDYGVKNTFNANGFLLAINASQGIGCKFGSNTLGNIVNVADQTFLDGMIDSGVDNTITFRPNQNVFASVAMDIQTIAGDNNTVGMWMTKNNTGTNVEDYTKNAYDLTSSADVGTFAQFKRGLYGYVFNGATANKTIGRSINDAAFSFGDTLVDSPFSVVFMGTLANGGDQCLISKCSDLTATPQQEWYLQKASSNLLILYLFDNSATVYSFRISDAVISVGTTHVWVATYNGTGGATAANGIKLYQDGLVVASTATNDGSYVAMEPLTEPLYLGSYKKADGLQGNYVNGDRNFAAVMKTCLTADQVWRITQKLFSLQTK